MIDALRALPAAQETIPVYRFFVWLIWIGGIFRRSFLRLVVRANPDLNSLLRNFVSIYGIFYGILMGLLAAAAYLISSSPYWRPLLNLNRDNTPDQACSRCQSMRPGQTSAGQGFEVWTGRQRQCGRLLSVLRDPLTACVSTNASQSGLPSQDEDFPTITANA